MDKAYWEKEIRGNWFKNHVATLSKQGDLTVLAWKKLNSAIFGVRYVFDGIHMYISGDIGQAVFQFTEIADPERIARYSLDYFEEKLKAFSRERRDFERKLALSQLKDRINMNQEEGYEQYPPDAVDALRRIIEDCTTVKEYQQKINEIDLYKFGNEYYEWLPELGSVIPGEIRAYLIGLQMANACLQVQVNN